MSWLFFAGHVFIIVLLLTFYKNFNAVFQSFHAFCQNSVYFSPIPLFTMGILFIFVFYLLIKSYCAFCSPVAVYRKEYTDSSTTVLSPVIQGISLETD